MEKKNLVKEVLNTYGCSTSKEIAQKAVETIGEDRIRRYYFDIEE